MFYEGQRTLRRNAVIQGIGLHSGKLIRCIIRPAENNHGIVFLRSDIRPHVRIRADISKVVRTEMSTTLGSQGEVVATVEHLMAALWGMGIDNALVEINGSEVPILDGSSIEFAQAIADAGISELGAPRKILRLKKRLDIRHDDKWIIGEPASSLSIQGSIQFRHPAIGDQAYRFNQQKNFLDELAGARTFGFVREVEFLHKKGLALGASLENAIVLDDETVLNPEGLRYKNEFVRHKVLDAIGDLALLGVSLEASIEVHKSGHALHAAFVRKLLEDPANYEIIELGQVPPIEEPLPALAAAY